MGYSGSVLEPKTAYVHHHRSVLMITSRRFYDGGHMQFSVLKSENIDYVCDKELNTSLIIVLNTKQYHFSEICLVNVVIVVPEA